MGEGREGNSIDVAYRMFETFNLNVRLPEPMFWANRGRDTLSGRTAFDVDLARTLIDRKRGTPGATLPILHDLQDEFGYIDDRVVPLIADALNISRAETLGVISFYHDYRRSPVDGRVLKLCRAESCQAMGCEDLVSHLERQHGIKVDAADGGAELHVETVYCLGNCALSPSALLDGEPIGRLDRDRLDAIVASAQGKTQ
jgi:formate dehydrogenase subunit gamma